MMLKAIHKKGTAVILALILAVLLAAAPAVTPAVYAGDCETHSSGSC